MFAFFSRVCIFIMYFKEQLEPHIFYNAVAERIAGLFLKF